MILAEKIVVLRKKAGLSQEDLADKLDVSRQSVSKWESGQSTPELDKIIMMSRLFDVSTDELLIDDKELSAELSTVGYCERIVSMEEAVSYVNTRFSSAKKLGIATVLCILSPLALIILAYLQELYNFSETLAASVGLAALFALVIVAVVIFMKEGAKVKAFEFFDEEFSLPSAVKEYLKGELDAYRSEYYKKTILATAICIFSVIPIVIASVASEFEIFALAFLFIAVSVGVFIFVDINTKNSSYKRLLRMDDYAPQNKRKNSIIEAFSTAYWLVATAVYLVWSFVSKDWDKTWLVWAVAGMLYAGVYCIIDAFIKK